MVYKGEYKHSLHASKYFPILVAFIMSKAANASISPRIATIKAANKNYISLLDLTLLREWLSKSLISLGLMAPTKGLFRKVDEQELVFFITYLNLLCCNANA